MPIVPSLLAVDAVLLAAVSACAVSVIARARQRAGTRRGRASLPMGAPTEPHREQCREVGRRAVTGGEQGWPQPAPDWSDLRSKALAEMHDALDGDVAPPRTGLESMGEDAIPVVYLGCVRAASEPVSAVIPLTAAVLPSPGGVAMPLAGTPAGAAAPALSLRWTEVCLAEEHVATPEMAVQPLPAEMDLYADPIDGVPFAPGEQVTLCACGTGYRVSTRLWLGEHTGGCCVQCRRAVAATVYVLPDPERLQLCIAS